MGEDIIHSRVCDIMTHHPRTTAADVLASTALETLNSSGITALFAVNDDGVPVGIVHIHDLLRVGIA
jgi:arabinose-5-phosphate isomerase